VIGWAAVTGGVTFEPLLLFLIIFFWTPPHFWALSLYRSDDYARAGVPMLPVVSGKAQTRRHILLYSLLLAPLAVAPWLLGYAGPLYGAVAVICGLRFLTLACRVYRETDGYAASKSLFGFSLVYLFVVFAALLADRLLAALVGSLGA
jgi:protoheme IX farnesyltransferase